MVLVAKSFPHQAASFIKRAKCERGVRCGETPVNHPCNRHKLRAAAVATCWRWVRGSPIERDLRNPIRRTRLRVNAFNRALKEHHSLYLCSPASCKRVLHHLSPAQNERTLFIENDEGPASTGEVCSQKNWNDEKTRERISCQQK